MQAHRLAGAHDVLVRHVFLAVHDVFADGAFKQPGVLQHHAKEIVHVFAGEIARGNAVDADAAAAELVKAHQQVDHGGLARARGADDGDFLPRLGLGGKVVDDDFFGIVSEMHVLEAHVAAHFCGIEIGGLARFVRKLIFFEKLKHALAGGGGRLHTGKGLRQLGQRGSEQPHIQREGDDRAEQDAPVCHEHGARHADCHVAEVAHKGHQRHHQPGKELRFPRAGVQFVVDVVEGLFHHVFGVVGLDDVVTRVRLLDVAVDVAEVALLAGKELLRFAHDEEHHDKAEQAGHDGGDCHDGIGDEHHDKAADEHDDGGDKGSDRLVERLTDHVHVVGDAGEGVPHRMGIEISKGQEVDLFGNGGTQVFGIFLRDRGHDKALHVREDHARAVQTDEGDAKAGDLLHIDPDDALHRGERELDHVREIAQNVWTDEVEHHAAHRKQQSDDDEREERLDKEEKFAHCLFEIFRLFGNGRPAHGAVPTRHTGMLFSHCSPPFLPVLPWKAENMQSRGTPRRSASAPRAYPYPRRSPRPAR